MASFSVANATQAGFGGTGQAMTTSPKSIISIVNGTSNSVNFPTQGAQPIVSARRGRIYDILIGTNSTPGDLAIQWDAGRLSAFGSSIITNTGGLSSVSSALALDIADYNCNAVLVANTSAETNITMTSQLWTVGINQRASYRWVAAPGSEMVYPATSSAGWDLRCNGLASFTGTVTATVLFTEL